MSVLYSNVIFENENHLDEMKIEVLAQTLINMCKSTDNIRERIVRCQNKLTALINVAHLQLYTAHRDIIAIELLSGGCKRKINTLVCTKCKLII